MSTSEQDLILNCQKGDLSQFGELYTIYVRKIYDFTYYRTQHKETAEDLTSQVFTRAMEKIKLYDNTKGSFSSWLYRIAKNAIYDHFQSSKFVSNIDDIWDLRTSENIERDSDTRLKLEKIEEYLKTLKPDQREIIIMRVWDGLSYKEISEILNKSEGSLKVAFARAISKIRDDSTLAMLILIPLLINLKIHG